MYLSFNLLLSIPVKEHTYNNNAYNEEDDSHKRRSSTTFHKRSLSFCNQSICM